MDGWDGLLGEGERIVWQGRPDTAIVWADLASMQTPMGVIFTGFSVFWMKMAASMTMGSSFDSNMPGIFRIFPLFGLIFFFMGLHMAGGRLLWDAWKRRGTHYTLTNRQAFIASAAFGKRSLQSYDIAPGTQLRLDDGPGGAVWFASKTSHRRGGFTGSANGGRRYRPPSTTVTPIGFRRLADPRAPYKLMRDLADTERPAEPGRARDPS